MTHPTPQFVPVFNSLTASGVELTVVYGGHDDLGRGWGALDFAHERMFVRGGPLRKWIAGFRLVATRNVSSVVVFGYTDPFAVGMLIAARMRRMETYTQSDSNIQIESRKPPLHRMLKRIYLRSIFARRTRVWTVGVHNSQYWESYGFGNLAPVAFESPIPVPEDLTRDAERTPNRVLFVGRVAPEKRPQDLIAAVDLLRKSTAPDLELWVAGDGDLSLLGSPMPIWLRHLGAVPHERLAALYASAAVVALPSSTEPYGLVVREALQFGTPVVASDQVPSARALCDRGWNIVPVGDIPELARALERALLDPGEWSPIPAQDLTQFYATQIHPGPPN